MITNTDNPPSIVRVTFPIFGLTWHGSQATPKNDGVSFLAYCGGGGSAKTGVGNKIVCDLVAQSQRPPDTEKNRDGSNNNFMPPPPEPTAMLRRATVEISTGEALCFGVHAFRPCDDNLDMIRLVACVGDEILLYGIPIGESEDGNFDEAGGAILLAKANVGNGYGANVATYTAAAIAMNRNNTNVTMQQNHQQQLQHLIGVGCENGHVVIFQINRESSSSVTTTLTKITECTGHTKAICAVQFHPRSGHHILSSAKDGTARIFDTHTGHELGVMQCQVHDPNGPPPTTDDNKEQTATTTIKKTTDPRMMKRPQQILVRGCAYGDLEGKTMYTIASGKRGPAYLTKWKTLVPLNAGVPGRPSSSSSPTSTNAAANNDQSSHSSSTALNVRQEYRVQCSPVPISATSLSSDCTIFAMGSVEGSILLYNLETQSILKQFNEAHDLPVTCIATRPIPNALMLPGELEGGVNFDAVSASADNRIGRWTLQKKSRFKLSGYYIFLSLWGRQRKRGGPIETLAWQLLRIPLILFLLFVIMAARDVTIVCREEFGMTALLLDMGSAAHCLYREVLWAEDTMPGVTFVPE